MADIFREVDEDVRRDRYLALWHRYRWLAIGGAALVVLGTVAGVLWRGYQDSQRTARGERFTAAAALAAAEHYGEAADAFADFADDVGAAYGAMARLREAAALAASGDRTAAIAVYDRIVEENRSEMLTDLARLFAAQQLLDNGDADGAKQRVASVAAGAGPWRHMARELDGIAALQVGRTEDARAVFRELLEEAGVPDGIRSRAGELLATLGERNAAGPR